MSETAATYKTLSEVVAAQRANRQEVNATWIRDHADTLRVVITGFRAMLENRFPTVWPLIRHQVTVTLTPEAEKGYPTFDRTAWFPFEDGDFAITWTAFNHIRLESPLDEDMAIAEDPEAMLLEMLATWQESRRTENTSDPLVESVGLLREALALLRQLTDDASGKVMLDVDQVDRLVSASEALISRAGLLLFEMDALD